MSTNPDTGEEEDASESTQEAITSKAPSRRARAAREAMEIQLAQDILTRGIFDPEQIKGLLERKLGRPLTMQRVTAITRRVYERWAEQDALHRPAAKSAAIRRVHDHVRKAAAGIPKLDPATNKQIGWLIKPDYSAVARFEQLLSDVEGTREPAKVEVSIAQREAIINVIGTMSREEADELIAEQRQADKLLDAHRRGKVIVAQGYEVGSAEPTRKTDDEE